MNHRRPQVRVLGGNFAGLGCAQKVREFTGATVRITDRRRALRLTRPIRCRRT